VAVRLRGGRLARFGYRPAEVLSQVETAYAGSVVAQTHRQTQVIDVRVILDPRRRADPREIGELPIGSAQGALLPLRELATVEVASGRDAISHEGGRRRQVVTCDVVGRDVASFVADAERTVRGRVELPEGAYLVFGGTAQARARAQRELLLHSGIGVLGILLLLSTAAGHWRNLALLLANAPLALVGGVLAVTAQRLVGAGEGGVSLGSLVGFATLFGITLRNAIMMVSHFQHLVQVEGARWGRETALRGASERVVPIAMTALVTGLGLLPLALGADRAGGEIDGPMAVVILGGLVSSTALNLLVLPLLCLHFGRFGARAPADPGGRYTAPASREGT
jgi:Cu/Ag efflux pump CusA